MVGQGLLALRQAMPMLGQALVMWGQAQLQVQKLAAAPLAMRKRFG